jgi:putative transposase
VLPSQLLSSRRCEDRLNLVSTWRFATRLEEAGLHASVGSRGDSYDNALAESLTVLYKTELIRKDGPWYGLEDVEHATMEYVHWFNTERLHSSIGMMPPAIHEARFRAGELLPTERIKTVPL